MVLLPVLSTLECRLTSVTSTMRFPLVRISLFGGRLFRADEPILKTAQGTEDNVEPP